MIEYKYYFNNEKYDTLLLIHGWNTTSLYMESFIRPFSNCFNVINVDLFSNLEKEYKISDFLDEINKIVRKHLKNKLVIIGHSFGGKLGYFYSKKYHVDNLVLIAPSLVKPRFNVVKFLKIKIYKFLKKHCFKIPKCLKGSKDYQNAQSYMKMTFLKCFNKYIKYPTLKNTPTIVIGFKKDKEVKKYQIRKIKKYLPNAKIIFYPGNHFAYLDLIKEIRIEYDKYFKNT